VLSSGATRTRTTKHVVAIRDIVKLNEIVSLLQRFQVERLAIEWVEHARMGGTPATLASKATDLARAQWVGGTLCGLALGAGLDVTLVINRTWVARVTGCKTTKGRRGMIAPAVEKRWPEIVGGQEDERDAAGVLAWFLMPPPEAKKAKREPGAPKARRERNAHRARTRERAEKRAATGCTCRGTRRHARTCARYVAVKEAANG
jgi:hypothetical protein